MLNQEGEDGQNPGPKGSEEGSGEEGKANTAHVIINGRVLGRETHKGNAMGNKQWAKLYDNSTSFSRWHSPWVSLPSAFLSWR